MEMDLRKERERRNEKSKNLSLKRNSILMSKKKSKKLGSPHFPMGLKTNVRVIGS